MNNYKILKQQWSKANVISKFYNIHIFGQIFKKLYQQYDIIQWKTIHDNTTIQDVLHNYTRRGMIWHIYLAANKKQWTKQVLANNKQKTPILFRLGSLVPIFK